jgi:hypothetical protein
MTTASSEIFERKARKQEAMLLQAFARTTGKAVALATGWSDSKVSRFFNEGNAEGVTEVACLARMLVELGLQVAPARHRLYDPRDIDALLGAQRMAARYIRPHHLTTEEANTQ